MDKMWILVLFCGFFKVEAANDFASNVTFNRRLNCDRMRNMLELVKSSKNGLDFAEATILDGMEECQRVCRRQQFCQRNLNQEFADSQSQPFEEDEKVAFILDLVWKLKVTSCVFVTDESVLRSKHILNYITTSNLRTLAPGLNGKSKSMKLMKLISTVNNIPSMVTKIENGISEYNTNPETSAYVMLTSNPNHLEDFYLKMASFETMLHVIYATRCALF